MLLASQTGKYGGPYDTTCSQIALMGDVGFESFLFAGYLKGDAPKDLRLDANLVPVRHWIPTPSFTGLFSIRFALGAWSAAQKSDVVHVSFARDLATVFLSVLLVLTRRPWIAQTHGMMTSRSSWFREILDRVVCRRILSHASSVIALTEHEKHELLSGPLRGMQEQRIAVLGNPLLRGAEPREDSFADGPIVFIARLHPRKNVRMFLDAAELMPDMSFEVYGPDEGDLQLVLSAERRLPNLRYAGAVPVDAVVSVLRQSAVFVLTSRNEPWGNVLAAALTIGLPCIVTESTALARDIRDAGAGIVVGDDDALGLARALGALRDPVTYRDTAAAASQLGKDRFDSMDYRNELARLVRIAAAERSASST